MTELVLRGYVELRKGASRVDWVWGLIVLIPFVVAVLDGANLDDVLRIATRAFAGTLPFIAIAVSLIGYLKASGAETVVARAFEGRETRMIFLAALFGGLAPFCSCEVIPFIAGLLVVGAPLSAVMAFWLSSPLIDPPTVLITAGALGWEFAIGKAVAAVTLGLMGGFGVRLLVRGGVFAGPLLGAVGPEIVAERPAISGAILGAIPGLLFSVFFLDDVDWINLLAIVGGSMLGALVGHWMKQRRDHHPTGRIAFHG